MPGHSIFGWSYPPGCSGPPDDMPEGSPLVDELLGALEDAGVPTEINDKIVKMVEVWETERDRQLDESMQAEYEKEGKVYSSYPQYWERTQPMEPKTPESIESHADKYKDGIWREYSLQELGNWVHLLAKRSAHRTEPAKILKDLTDAQNYLNMMQAHLDALQAVA